MPANSQNSAMKGLNKYLDVFNRFGRGNDFAFAGAVCIVLAVLFVPLPSFLLDLGFALSFAVSILMLMVALWIKKPLEFNSYPSLLLVVTVMRLALGVASTRLILSEGHTGPDAAGDVIHGIANFVIGGNYVIGAIIFVILVMINFIVITKGSTRIAEVSARFSLDAMPGKQMAIDADLGSGLIDENEARRRRKEVEGESSFFGAMDGASKFVRGDAIAGIIITIVNIVGGLIIGTMMYGMPLMQALQTYTILTIGDGLVTQIPALIVAISAGMIVTKGSTEGASGEAVIGQLVSSPKPMYVTAGLIFGIGLMPGFPLVIFTLLALVFATIGLVSERRNAEALAEEEAEKRRLAAQPEAGEAQVDNMKIDTIRLEIGSGLLAMIGEVDGALPGKVQSLRNYFMQEFGFVLPGVRIKDTPLLGTGGYSISIQGVNVAEGEVVIGSRMVIDPAETITHLPGVRVKEPTFGLSALWIDEALSAQAEEEGQTVVDAESVIITHLTEVIREHMPDLLTYAEVLDLHKRMTPEYRKLITDLPDQNPINMFKNVLKNLLAERISIRNIELIAEAIAETGGTLKTPGMVTEYVRRSLSAQICKALEDSDHYVNVITLGASWEQEFGQNTKVNGEEIQCVLSPKRAQDFVLAAQIEIQKFAKKDQWPAVLVHPDYRRTIRSMLLRVSPMTQIISNAEIHRRTRIRNVGKIGE